MQKLFAVLISQEIPLLAGEKGSSPELQYTLYQLCLLRIRFRFAALSAHYASSGFTISTHFFIRASVIPA
jgi:hypothetical protein